MELLLVLTGVVVIGMVVVLALTAIGCLLGPLLAFWPAGLGLLFGIVLWRTGHDNLGVAVAVIGLAFQVWWSQSEPFNKGRD